MKFSNFAFLETAFPELYRLAGRAEAFMDEDPYAALIAMKQLLHETIRTAAGRHATVAASESGDGLLHALWKNRLIDKDTYAALREIELFDARESELVVDLSRADVLYMKIYDFLVWVYQTYADASFVPAGFVQRPKTTSLSAAAGQGEEKRPNSAEPAVSIDGTARQADWRMSLRNVGGYTVKHDDDGETYEGQLVRGLKHGQGSYTWRDGTVYTGQWNKDMEHGYGEKRFANGDAYRGHWKNGAFEGHGVYEWKDGTVYEGQWQNHLEHGFGTKTSGDGTKREGFWTSGEFVYTTDRLPGGKPRGSDNG